MENQTSISQSDQRLTRFKQSLVLVVFLSFTAFNIYVLTLESFWNFFPPFEKISELQVFVDLGLSLSLVQVWIFLDLRKKQQPLWVFVFFCLFTIALGSMSPLFYLVLREFHVLDKKSKT